jgi:hypothetical protein
MGQRLTSLHTHIAWDMDDGGYTTQAEQDGPYGSNDWHCKWSHPERIRRCLLRACDHYLFVQAMPLTGMTHGHTCTTGAASIGIGFTKCTGDKTQKRKTNIFCELVVLEGIHDITDILKSPSHRVLVSESQLVWYERCTQMYLHLPIHMHMI